MLQSELLLDLRLSVSDVAACIDKDTSNVATANKHLFIFKVIMIIYDTYFIQAIFVVLGC